MPDRSRWARGSNQYAKRTTRTGGRGGRTSGSPRPASESRAQHEMTGISWDAAAIDLDEIRPSELTRARSRFRSRLPELIWNAAALEGNTFTLPEVRTLLDGVTVGGKRLHDEEQILALSEGYSTLDRLLEHGGFDLTREVSNRLHGLIARHEALDAGLFRGEGSVTGGGTVRRAGSGHTDGRDHGENGDLLIERFDRTVDYVQNEIPDPRMSALVYFAAATRHQFYFDGNKRTARLMMSGILMRAGFDAVQVPYARKLEFNLALDRLFRDDDATELIAFLATCAS